MEQRTSGHELRIKIEQELTHVDIQSGSAYHTQDQDTSVEWKSAGTILKTVGPLSSDRTSDHLSHPICPSQEQTGTLAEPSGGGFLAPGVETPQQRLEDTTAPDENTPPKASASAPVALPSLLLLHDPAEFGQLPAFGRMQFALSALRLEAHETPFPLKNGELPIPFKKSGLNYEQAAEKVSLVHRKKLAERWSEAEAEELRQHYVAMLSTKVEEELDQITAEVVREGGAGSGFVDTDVCRSAAADSVAVTNPVVVGPLFDPIPIQQRRDEKMRNQRELEYKLSALMFEADGYLYLMGDSC